MKTDLHIIASADHRDLFATDLKSLSTAELEDTLKQLRQITDEIGRKSQPLASRRQRAA
ncbi:hypothetical protein [Aaestuariibius violaceus]|uniref:hypothetical protein n=1 Tax=Aestuariibius violaceus TaxID=3234132 RepID=UPI00398E5AE6